jgi:hypothetical protein
MTMTAQELQEQLNTIKNSKLAKTSDKRISHQVSFFKPIHQYGLDGKYIATFESITLASKALNHDLTDHMSSHVNGDGKRPQIAGYMWRYEKYDSIEPYHNTQKLLKKVAFYNLDGSHYMTFDSISDATRHFYPKSKRGMSFTHLLECFGRRYIIKKM